MSLWLHKLHFRQRYKNICKGYFLLKVTIVLQERAMTVLYTFLWPQFKIILSKREKKYITRILSGFLLKNSSAHVNISYIADTPLNSFRPSSNVIDIPLAHSQRSFTGSADLASRVNHCLFFQSSLWLGFASHFYEKFTKN